MTIVTINQESRLCQTDDSNKPLYHYCIIRADLPNGVQKAQLIHAAGESSPGKLPSGTFAVCLAAENEAHLLELEQALLNRGIPHNSIREPDAPYLGSIMAIGIVPCDRRSVKSVTSKLPKAG
jgi:hypothetical protein